jgi:hypothetical protein
MFVGVAGVSPQTETGVLFKKHTFELAHEISYRIYKEPDVWIGWFLYLSQ